jgi:hypothetical protein
MVRHSGQAEHVLDDETHVAELAKQRLSEDRLYRFYFREITCSCEDGVLTLEGRVPSFYLKQVLQTMLFGVGGVDRIDNRVDVVNSSGLSSVRELPSR